MAASKDLFETHSFSQVLQGSYWAVHFTNRNLRSS